jgi:hypothetical protein
MERHIQLHLLQLNGGGFRHPCTAARTGLAFIAGPYRVAEIAAGLRCITVDRRQRPRSETSHSPRLSNGDLISLVGLRAGLGHGKPIGFDTEIQKNDRE